MTGREKAERDKDPPDCIGCVHCAAGIYDGRRDDVRDFCLKYIRNPSAVPWLEATTTRFERFNGECGKDAKFYEPLPSPVPGAGG